MISWMLVPDEPICLNEPFWREMMTMQFLLLVPKRIQRLHWTLTLSYLVTSVSVLCLLELLVTVIGIAVITSGDSGTLQHRTQLLARIAGSASPPPGVAQQQQWQALWELLQERDPAFQGYLAAVDAQGRVIVAVGDHAPAPGYDLWLTFPASVRHEVQGSLSSSASSPSPHKSLLRTSFVQGSAYVVAPLVERGTTQGALVVRGYYVRSSWENGLNLLLFFGVSAVIFLLGAGAVGLAFGIITARSLVHRLRRIATAINGWSQGDFSLFVHDPSRDEVGQLARHLNQMARQLQHLLKTRQDLASLEERNRLARDLHDSVKQQVFAVSLHVSTSRALLGSNEQDAQTHLAKAEGLIHQAQRELTTLIHALRPVALEGRSLADALQDYVPNFQEQTGIPIELEVDGEAEVPPELEHAFFRIAQEGLANVARHSRALAVNVHLTCSDVVTLSISDNGRGFDIQRRDQQGFGLTSMRERVQALGGHLDIQSAKDQGTTITAWCQQTERDVF